MVAYSKILSLLMNTVFRNKATSQKKQLTVIFEKLEKDGIVKYIPATNNASINFFSS